MNRKLTFSVYKRNFDVSSNPITASWEWWCEELGKLHVVSDKNTFCLVLGNIPKGQSHTNASVGYIDALGVDLDDITDVALEQVYKALSGFEYVMYSTHGHSSSGDKLCTKLRIILPLAEKVEPKDFKQWWDALNVSIGGHNDAQTRNEGRLWYVHSCPASRKDDALFYHNSGSWLSKGDLFSATSVPSPSPDVSPAPPEEVSLPVATATSIIPLTADFLISEGKRRSRRKDTRDRLLGSLLLSLGRGESFAEKGSRERSRYLLCDTLADIWPDLDIPQATELFRPSLTSMHVERPLKLGIEGTLREVSYKLKRAKNKFAQKVSERKDKQRTEESRINLEARGDGKDTPYSDEDLQLIAERQDCHVDDLKNRWVCYKNGSSYFLNMVGYQGPFSKPDCQAVASTYFSPIPYAHAYNPPAGRSKVKILKTYSELCSQHGSIIRDIEASLTQNYSSFNKRTGKLTEATAPKDDSIRPKQNPIVQTWLNLMSKEDTGKLIDWIAAVPRLDQQCCALYLWGPKGTGKTLLLNGLSRIWGLSDTTPLDAVVDGFNERLARMPLICADEYLPDVKNLSGKLRELIGSASHTLKRKYLPEASLTGTVRLVILGNTPHLLDLKGDHTKEDLDAIAERFLFIHTHKDAAKYLTSLSRETKQHLLNKGIAEHCLWLAKHWDIDEGKRFLVEGFLGDASLNISINNERTALICEWLVEYLTAPEALSNNQRCGGLVKISEGALWVNSYAIQKAWTTYMDGGGHSMSARAIGIALKAIASKEDHSCRRERVNGQQRSFYRIDTELLASWSEAHGRMSFEDISRIVGCAPF